MIYALLFLLFNSISAEEAVVKLDRYHNGELYAGCTATYVGPNAILTAAHCVKYYGFISRNNYPKAFDNLLSRMADATVEKRTGVALEVPLKTEFKIKGRALNISKIILHYWTDLAILVTTDKTKDYVPISFEKLEVGQPVEMFGSDINKIDSLSGGIGVIGAFDINNAGGSGGPLISKDLGIIGVAKISRQCNDGKAYISRGELSSVTNGQGYIQEQEKLASLYGDVDLNARPIYKCEEKHGDNDDAYSASEYSMLKADIPFIKFAIKNDADIKMINVDKDEYQNASSDGPYFKVYTN